MAELDDGRKRDRDYLRRGAEDRESELEPGKRSLVEATMRGHVPAGADVWPGKRTLSERLPAASVAPQGVFREQLELAQHSIGVLASANQARDARASNMAACRLRSALARAEKTIALAERTQNGDTVEMRESLDAIATAAQPVLAAAFNPSRVAIDEAARWGGTTRAQWDKEVAAWSGVIAQPTLSTLSSSGTSAVMRERKDEDRPDQDASPDKQNGNGKDSAKSVDAKLVDGTYRAGSVLPLPDEIRPKLESATGMSLSHVRVHDDEHGHAVAAAHGARAVAIGSDIFMGAGQLDTGTRDGRELMAHEVAHVTQAAGTANPRAAAKKAATSIDAAEIEADSFATEFSERGGAMAWRPTVDVADGTPMRAPPTAQAQKADVKVEKPDVAWAYLRANEDQFLTAIQSRLSNFLLPADERLSWVKNGLSTRFHVALTSALGSAPLFIKLPEIVYPADPWYSIDQHRSLTEGTPGIAVDGRDPVGPLAWNFLAGESVATDIQRALATSLAHMIPRFLVQVEAKPSKQVDVADLVTSHPVLVRRERDRAG